MLGLTLLQPTGFDINMIPGLENFIDNQIHATLGPMMYDPNVFTINLEQLLSSAPIGKSPRPGLGQVVPRPELI